MSGEKNGSKADTLVKVVLVFFISLLSFSVGTFVGKQVSDSDHRRVALEGEYKGGRKVASEDGAAHGEDSGDKITDKEVESLTEEFVNKEKAEHGSVEHSEHHETAESAHGEGAGDHKAEEAQPAVAHKEDAGHKADAHAAPGAYKEYKRGDTKAAAHDAPKAEPMASAEHKTASKADATHKVAGKVAEGQAPTDGHTVKDRKPSSILPSVANTAVGKYTVQVASYAEESEAKSQAAELKSKGWTAFYLPAQVNGKTWYRVTVGLFNNYKAAQEFRGQFMKEANVKTAIVQKIVQ